MDYTLQDILENQHQDLLNKHSQFKIFKIQKSFNGLNNQNRIGWEFLQSRYYKQHNRIKDFRKYYRGKMGEHIWKKSNQLWNIPQFGVYDLDQKITKIKPESLEFKDIEPYFKYLAWHISIDLSQNPKPRENYLPCRWGDNRVFYDHYQEKFNYIKQSIDLINENLDNKDFEWDKVELDWHEFLGFSWSLIQCGLGEYALDVVNPLFELHTRTYKDNKSIISFVMPALRQDYKLRIRGTLSWIKAFAYKQMGENDEYYNVLDGYVKYFEEVGCDHYNVTNRVLEASILVYKHRPTPENKKRCISLFQHCCSLFMDEPTECIRERGLVVYDFAKTIFKEDYEKYNS